MSVHYPRDIASRRRELESIRDRRAAQERADRAVNRIAVLACILIVIVIAFGGNPS